MKSLVIIHDNILSVGTVQEAVTSILKLNFTLQSKRIKNITQNR